MLAVAALQIGHPVGPLVLVKADDLPLQNDLRLAACLPGIGTEKDPLRAAVQVEQLRGGLALAPLPHEVHLRLQRGQGQAGFMDQQHAGIEQERRAGEAERDGRPGVLPAADRHHADGDAGAHEHAEGPVEPRRARCNSRERSVPKSNWEKSIRRSSSSALPSPGVPAGSSSGRPASSANRREVSRARSTARFSRPDVAMMRDPQAEISTAGVIIAESTASASGRPFMAHRIPRRGRKKVSAFRLERVAKAGNVTGVRLTSRPDNLYRVPVQEKNDGDPDDLHPSPRASGTAL